MAVDVYATTFLITGAYGACIKRGATPFAFESNCAVRYSTNSFERLTEKERKRQRNSLDNGYLCGLVLEMFLKLVNILKTMTCFLLKGVARFFVLKY